MSVSDAVRDSHHDGGGRSVSAYVGDENSHFVFGQRKEIVIVAAGPFRRLIVGGKVQGWHARKFGRKQRPLDLADGFHFVVQGTIGFAQIVLQNEIARRPPEEATPPYEIGDLFFVEQGKGKGFGMLGCVVLWERLDDLDKVPTRILATTNWKFENSQVLSLKRGSK